MSILPFRILQLDENHPLIESQLKEYGYDVENDFKSGYQEILRKIHLYQGIIIRSRLPLDAHFLQSASHLQFIARVGAGMENIDTQVAREMNIRLIHSPEGNQDALAEHAVALLLNLMNRISISHNEVKNGIWLREENRGDELLGKCIGLIGYGYMGKAFAKRLHSFGVHVIFHDILPNLTDENAVQVALSELQQQADVLSLHLPLNASTLNYVDEVFISKMKKKFYFINTARGRNVNTKDLLSALNSGKIKAAGLDVVEFEKTSFEGIETNPILRSLLEKDNVIITPHIAGWTMQSKEKLAQVIVDKILKINML